MSKISAYSELGGTPDVLDEFVIVDKSDTSMSASGTTKKVQAQYLTISDASTTLKGKVELATDAETITGTDTVRAVTPANITAKIDTDGTLAGNLDTRIPSQKAVKTYTDASVSGLGDWRTIQATITFSSSDSPIFVVTTSVDLTSVIGVGMKIKLTHSSSLKFFFVHAITSGTMTLYGGTDYTLSASAITLPSYSTSKCPIGFPLDPLKWGVYVTDPSSRLQASPSSGTVYNPGTTNVQISVPIGSWKFGYEVNAYVNNDTATDTNNMSVSLSTANNSHSDVTMKSTIRNSGASGSWNMVIPARRERSLSVSVKTLYYLVCSVDASSVENIGFRGDVGNTNLFAVSAYL